MKFTAYNAESPDDDLLLVQWYQHLVKEDELSLVFMPAISTPGKFLATFQSPSEMLYVTDDTTGTLEGRTLPYICMAVWWQAYLPGVCTLGAWTRKDLRKKGLTLRLLRQVIESLIVQKVHAFVVTTRQLDIVRQCENLGFKAVAEVPDMWGDDTTGFLMVMTKEQYEDGKAATAVEG